jgi:hypothetical protein
MPLSEADNSSRFDESLNGSNVAKGCKTKCIHHENISSKCKEKFEGNIFLCVHDFPCGLVYIK